MAGVFRSRQDLGWLCRPAHAPYRRATAVSPTVQDLPAVPGADDDQLPALECIPALVASHRCGFDTLLQVVLKAVAITHDDPLARAAVHARALALHHVV